MRWSSEIHQDFFWWLDRERRELVISPEQVSSQLDLWSNSSDVGWGSTPRRGGSFQPLVSRGAAQLHPSSRSFNNFLCVCAGRSAIPSLFCLSSSWGTTLCWQIFSLVSIQFWVPSGSWHCQGFSSFDLFATSLTHRCLLYFSPFHNSNALGTEVLIQPWDGWQAYAFPPYALIPTIL